jgi:hypothetical membrane protein
MSQTITHLRARYTGATLLIAAAVIYLVGEAIAAAAWSNPSYRYSYNWVSDLGVPHCGDVITDRVVCSPHAAAMNTAFVLQGVLFIIAAMLLAPLLPKVAAWAYRALAVVHGVGISIVGLVHGSEQAIADGTIAVHFSGAAMAIFGGNLVAVVFGVVLLTWRRIAWGALFIGLGVLGIISAFLMLNFVVVFDDAVAERAAVYSAVAAELIAGIIALVWLRRRSRLQAGPEVVIAIASATTS